MDIFKDSDMRTQAYLNVIKEGSMSKSEIMVRMEGMKGKGKLNETQVKTIMDKLNPPAVEEAVIK